MKKLAFVLAFTMVSAIVASAATITPTDNTKKVAISLGTTAQTALGASTLTDFPVLVRLSTAIEGFTYEDFQQNAGADLVFADADNNALDFEIDTWNDQGESLVWVKVPSLSATSVIYAYYGGNAYAHTPSDTWSAYLGVWHFSGHDASGITPDATVNGLDGNSGDFTEITGRVGGAAQGVKGIAVANYEPAHSVGGTFSASGWFKLPNQTTQYTTFITKKTGLSWDASTGWYLEMPQSKTKVQFITSGSTVFGSGGTAVPDVSQNWNYFHLTSNGSSINLYLNGNTTPVATGSTTVKASSVAFTMLGNGHQGDEFRLSKTAHSALRASIEYATMAQASFLSYGAVEVMDATAPVFNTPTVVKDGSDFVFSVDLLEGEGTISAVYTAGAAAITNALATSDSEYPKTYSATASGLAADTTYAFSAYGINANQTEVLKSGGTFHTGNLTVVKTQDAQENGLVNGIFTVTRGDANNDLTVTYTVGGTATAGQTYAALSGTVTIPAGSTTAPIVVTPLMDGQTTEDTTVVVTLSDGLYGIDEIAGSATLTVVNLVVPAGYNTWVAQASGKASVAQNWSEGRVPNSTDNILFDGRFSTSDCEWDGGVNSVSTTVASWTQQSDYSGTVTIATMYPEVPGATFTRLTVSGDMTLNGGKVTQVANDIQKEEYRLNLAVGGNLAVTSPGMIDVSAKGPRGVMSGRTENTYGGDAGTFGKTYGNPKQPYYCGSGNNGNWSSYYKSAGGGAAWIEVGGAVSLSGSIRANGGRFSTSSSGELTSGGNIGTSGGSVYLKAASLSGTGTIQASAIVSGDNKAASGGRIAIELTGADNALPLDNMKAWADTGIAGHCGVGTIVVKNPGQPNGTLILRGNPSQIFSYNSTISDVNRMTSMPQAAEWTFDGIVFGDFGQLVVPVGCTLNLPNGFASVSASNLVSNANSLYASGILVRGGTVNAPAVNAKHTFGGGKWTFHPASNFVFDADVVVKDGANLGTLAMASTSTSYHRCWFTVDGNLTVESTGVVRAENGGVGGNGTAQDAGGFIAYPFGKTWGTGHGGQNGMCGLVNNAYGSIFSPVLPGTPGGHHDYRYTGGGAIMGTVSGTLTVDGSVSSGSSASVGRTGWSSHAPAPGSINLVAGSLAGTGTITANGASGLTSVNANSYGASGGGRVTVRLTGDGATFSEHWQASILARGYTYSSRLSNPTNSASAGSVYLQTAAQAEKAGTIVIRNDGVVGNLAWTPIPSAVQADAAADFKKASLTLAACAKARLYETLKMAALEMGADTAVDLNGKTLTVDTAIFGDEKLGSGTYTAAQAQAAGATGIVDSGEGGTLVVMPTATVICIR
ncbi:MAG: DUF2341 domain-containing protein [Kiritimatiellae bacterium]|nr:DUF2341 domain-containing protein [Kiritimatiellia bacterium]